MYTMVKAQFKIQQMAFMLLAVFIFFLLVAIFWFVLQTSSIKQQANALNANQALILSKFISGATEFSCNNEQADCIDTDKLLLLQNSSLKSFFPFSIKIIKIYPKQDKEIICNKANYPNCNTYIFHKPMNSTASSIGSFVALCRKENNLAKICDLGKIIIQYELK